MSPVQPRIGVFVCHCGSNIGGVVDVPAVAEYAQSLPGVAHVEANLYTCSEDGLGCIKDAIREHDLDRVVVASCTPRTHDLLFKNTCEEAGLNRYLFEFVNIREHCSWIHGDVKAEATEKARRLVWMGVSKAALLAPQEETESPVVPAALVLGGGVAGLTAARTLARQGFAVHLVEKAPQLGGRLRSLDRLLPTGRPASELIEPLVEQVEANPRITVYRGARVEEVSGYVGAFRVTVSGDGAPPPFDVGTVVVATGADVLEPHGLFGYGRFPNVMTQLELEQRLQAGDEEVARLERGFVSIHCVGSRIPERPDCARICCMTSIKNAEALKRRNPDVPVYAVHRDLLTSGVVNEQIYRRAREAGVRFLRYELARPPEIVGDGEAREVVVHDALRHREMRLPVDLVALSTPLVAAEDNRAVSQLLKVPLGPGGFFLEAHVKLRPVEFATDGVTVCGTARWPADISETIAQTYAAASKAAIPMRAGSVTSEAITAYADPVRCIGCGTCIPTCPYGAITSVVGDDGRRHARVSAVQCKGCGGCVAVCPNAAMQQRGFTDQQVLQMIDVCARS